MSAPIPAELREAAGRAAHARNWLGRDEAARLHVAGDCPCGGCARWPDLTESQREAFRASQDPALALLAPVLRESLAVARNIGQLHEHAQGCWGGTGPGFNGCDCGFALAVALADRLAALGVK